MEKNKDNQIKLDTLIQQGIAIKESLDRFNRHLVMNNEIMKQLDETIKIHLASIKKIGENTDEFCKLMNIMNKKLKEIKA